MANIPLRDVPNAPDLSSMSAPQTNTVNVPSVDFSGERAAVARAYEGAKEDPRSAGMVGGAVADAGSDISKSAKTLADKQQALTTDVAKIDFQSKVAEFDNNFWVTADHTNYQTYGNQYLKRFDDEVGAWYKSQPTSVQQGVYLDYLHARNKGFVGASNAAHQQDLTTKFVTAWDGIQQQAARGDYGSAYEAAEKATSSGLFNPKQKEEAFSSIEATKASNYATFKIQADPEVAAKEFSKAAETGSVIPGLEVLSAKEYSNFAKLAENVAKYQQADKGTAVYNLIDSKEIKTLAQLEKSQAYQQLTQEWKEAAKSKLLNEVLADTPEGNLAVGDSFGLLAKFATGDKGDLNLDYEKLTRIAGTLPAADSKQFLDDAKELYQARVRGKGSLPTEIAQRYEMSSKLYDWYKGGVFGAPESKKAVEALKQAESDWKNISSRNQGTLIEAKKEFLMQYRKEAAAAALIPDTKPKGWIKRAMDWMDGGKPQASNDNRDAAGKVTEYYPSEGYRSATKGPWENKLDNDSLAVSPDIQQKLKEQGIKPFDKVKLTLANGQTVIRRYDDHTATDEEARKQGLSPLRGRYDFRVPVKGASGLDGVKVAKVEKYTEDGRG